MRARAIKAGGMSLWKKRAVALSTVARAPSSLAPASASAMAPAGADPSSSGTSGAFAALAAAVAATALGVAVSTNTAHADSAQSSGTRVWVKRTPGAVPTRAGTASEDEEQDEEEEEEVQAIEVAHSREESATQEPQGTNKKLNRTGSAAFADGPFFTRAEVEAHYEWDPKSAAADPEKRVWVTYNRGVYDITDFLKNHPGGHERIMGAAGGDVAPFWQQYQQHYAPHVYAQLAELRIGTLAPGEEVVKLNASDDPYVAEPKRVEALAAAALKVKPYNAESPTLTLDSVGAAAAAAATLEAGKAEGDVPRVSFLTPNELWYVRHHHPVPVVDPAEYRMEISMHASPKPAPSLEEQRELSMRDASGDTGFPVKTYVHESGPGEAEKAYLAEDNSTFDTAEGSEISLSLDDLDDASRFPPARVCVTMQCAGNRRSELHALAPTQGLHWGCGAVSTAVFEGVWLRDVIKASLGIGTEEEARKKGIRWVQISGIDDPFDASIPIEKALDPRGDVIVATKMNGVALPREHGYPVRIVVPGFLGARSVKWADRVVLSPEMSYSTWQRGVAYKALSATETKHGVGAVVTRDAYSVMELPVQSCVLHPREGDEVHATPSTQETDPRGDAPNGTIKVHGFAWSGGGRNITRVDVSADGGTTWTRATLKEGATQPYGRAWAWTLWDADVPIPSLPAPHAAYEADAAGVDKGTKTGKVVERRVELVCRALDVAQNQQPESPAPLWNLRGILNNAWHRVGVTVVQRSDDVE